MRTKTTSALGLVLGLVTIGFAGAASSTSADQPGGELPTLAVVKPCDSSETLPIGGGTHGGTGASTQSASNAAVHNGMGYAGGLQCSTCPDEASGCLPSTTSTGCTFSTFYQPRKKRYVTTMSHSSGATGTFACSACD